MRLASLTIVPLDKTAASRLGGELAALDSEARRELGDAYSHEDWDVGSFVRELPGKWDLSRVALVDGRPCGFWIASHEGGEAHTHRVLVSRAARGAGAGHMLWEAVAAAARRRGCASMTLTLNKLNGEADRFYQGLGFRRMRGAEFTEFARRRGKPGAVVGDEIEERHGHGQAAYHGLWRVLEDA